jgi:hypothetical protein
MFWNKQANNKEGDLDSVMIELGREIERGFAVWNALPINHWGEKMEDFAYHKGIKLMVTSLLEDTSFTDEDRIKRANSMLDFSKTYRDKVNSVSQNYKEFVTSRLSQFEEMLQPLLKIKRHDEEQEWLWQSKILCSVREKEMVAVNVHIDSDEFIPKLFIQDNGKADHQMTAEENNSFKEIMIRYGTLREDIFDEQKKIEPNRSKISERLFGKLNNYLKDGSYFRLLNEIKKD